MGTRQASISRAGCTLTLGLVISITSSTGCQWLSHHTIWSEAGAVPPKPAFDCHAACQTDSSLSIAESAYARAFQFEANGDARCVDHYFQAATLTWPVIAQQLQTGSLQSGRGRDLYRSALRKLLSTGQHFKRLDPSQGITVQTSTGSSHIPMTFHGFPWQPEEFDALIPVGEYRTKELNTIYSGQGLGVATVAHHFRQEHERFRRDNQVFSATAVLRPTTERPECRSFSLELFDSLRISHIQIGERSVPLRRDISAPFAYVLKDVKRDYLAAFLRPGSTDTETGLFTLEPYQPGKIPVVLVHGLLSDPLTWANIANELRARPDLMARYQIWGFEYATGKPFLRSAAILREDLRQIQSSVERVIGSDAALGNVVLVGHSMGGLVSKLQVTHSGDDIWSAVSNRPFEAISASPTTRLRLATSAYFEPSEMVTRVVYVATPHRGSPWARRSIGRFGASLVEEPSPMRAEHEQLLRDHPDAFSPEFTRRIPTSIDLLRPDSPLLHAIDRLPVARHVREHSIIGSFRPMLLAGDSDGVVPVASAHRANATSEKVIRARHSKIHQAPEGIKELVRILRRHMNQELTSGANS